ncbi:MAG: hypothetical protein KAI53_03500 [Candidatus Aenigmarchaeota archaeon]|nr:hypothetical protein [Candidatus Aenigmarchaeota archaeon]
MVEYNSAFFGLYENVFLVLKNAFGVEKALDLFKEIMKKGLKESYDLSCFKHGSAKEFSRVVGKRDKTVGLNVEFSEVTEKRIVYQIYTDPFPKLRGVISYEKLDDTYMSFKVSYLLGNKWGYKTTRHFWKGDKYTEHIITKQD